MGLRPIKKKVLLAQIKKKENATEGGIILTGTTDDLRSTQFLVLEVGPDVEYVKKDDKVLIEVGKSRDVKVGDMACLIIEETDIVAILDDDNDLQST